MLPSHHQPHPSPTSSRIPEGLKTIHTTPEPARVLGVGLWGSLKGCRPPVPPSHLVGLEQGQGCLLEMKRPGAPEWGWESEVCHPPDSEMSRVQINH